MLVEGNSLRATSRLADVVVNTVMKLLVDVGRACTEYQYKIFRNLTNIICLTRKIDYLHTKLEKDKEKEAITIMMITPKEAELLKFIYGYLNKNHLCPSYKEIMKSVNIRSGSQIVRLIDILVEHGYVRKIAGKRRALEIIKLPEYIYIKF